MRQRLRLVVLFLVGVICLAGCTSRGPGPDVSPLLSPQVTPVVGVQLPDDGRGETARAAYPIAEVEAKRWNSAAILYQIPVTRIMETNLGLPSSTPGWYFMFKVPDSPLEYYVKIVRGRVSGVTEAQPILIEELPYEYLPIDLRALTLDSDDALQLFMEHGGAEYVAAHPGLQLDYRLVHLDGQDHPVWSLFDVSDVNQPPLFNVDAVTGEVVGDPFSQYQ